MIRTITTADAPDLLAYFQELVEIDRERVERPEDVSGITLDRERIWISEKLEAERNHEMIIRCAEDSGKVVGLGEVERLKRWIERHVAEIRFGLMPNRKEVGLELVQTLEMEAINLGVEVLIFFHIETQEQGLEIMHASGFGDAGRIPAYYKRAGGYHDRLYLVKRIQ